MLVHRVKKLGRRMHVELCRGDDAPLKLILHRTPTGECRLIYDVPPEWQIRITKKEDK